MTTSTGVPAAEPGAPSASRATRSAGPVSHSAGRVNQKARTRAAIVRAVQDLARDGAEITMPSVARAALVSEATAYRYFPDLVSLLLESDVGVWPDPAEALAPVAGSDDPVERVGYAADAWLFYVKGGGAWMNVRYGQALVTGGITGFTQTVTDTRSGFTAGAGIEYGLTENFSARLEYDFYDFGTQTYNQFVQTPISIKSDMHAVTFGLNYRFNWAGGRPY